jgi:hypothetical protein
LSNIIFGIKFCSDEGFNKILQDLDTFAYPPLSEIVKTTPLTASNSENLTQDKGGEILKKVLADDQKKAKLEMTSHHRPYDFETEKPSKKSKFENLFSNEDVEGEYFSSLPK